YLDEAEWVDELAGRDSRVLGAVVCLPLERGRAIEPEIEKIAKLASVRGVRRLIQNQPDPEYVLRQGFLEAIRLLPQYGLSFDVCIFHAQAANTLKMMRACPDVAFVLDHIGKPGIKMGLLDPWRQHIREMAALLQREGYSVAALRALAKRRLPRMLFDMVDGAAGDEITMRRNEQALADIELMPKVLAGAPKRDQSIELFGDRIPSPIVIGPTGLAGLLWPHAELAAARAAARFGTAYSVSHASTATIEEIGAATAGPK